MKSDREVQRMLRERNKGKTLEQTAARAGMSVPTARKYLRAGKLPSQLKAPRAGWIAEDLHCDDQTVRNAIHDFNTTGLAALTRGSHVPHTTPHAAFDVASLAALPTLLARSPRTFDKDTGVWTLDLLAEVTFTQGLTSRRVSDEAIRGALKHLGIAWKRAKHWVTSPDPQYTQKNISATA